MDHFSIKAAKKMDTTLPTVSATATLEQAWQHLQATGASAVLVGAPDALVGVVPRHQIEAAREAGQQTDEIGPLTRHTGLHAHPDQPLDVVLARLGEAGGVLPIVSRDNVRRVEGAVTAESILRGASRGGQATPGP